MPKIRFWDVETLSMKAAVFNLWPNSIPHNSILQHSAMICASWGDLGDDHVYQSPIVKFNKDGTPDDREVVQATLDGLADADILVGHNGDNFDLKTLNTRAVYHGLAPLPPIKTIDTLKVAKRHFRFPSNRLDALGDLLGVGRKVETDKDLWLRCLKGEKKALKDMAYYNIGDIELLEDVYLKLLPFMTNHPNLGIIQGKEDICPNCGTQGKLQKRGFSVTRVSRKQRYQCTACGSWSHGPAKQEPGVTIR